MNDKKTTWLVVGLLLVAVAFIAYSAGKSNNPSSPTNVPQKTTATTTIPTTSLKKLGDTCSNSQECSSGLYCSVTQKRCVQTVSAGAKCGGTSVCAAGYACDKLGRCIRTGASVTPTKNGTGGLGEPCTNGVNCDDNLVCNSQKRCAVPEPAGIGQTCADRACNTGLICDGNLRCAVPIKPQQLGEVCSSLAPCDTGLVCENKRCIKK